MRGHGEGQRGSDETTLVSVARYSGHGLTLALAMGFFLFLGWIADGRLGTTPLLTVLGALVGAGAGFYHMLQHIVLRPRAREEERRGQEEGDERDPPPGRSGR